MNFAYRQRFARLRPYKRTIITSSVLLFILVAVGYGLWSKSVWAEYEPSYTQWRQSVKIDVDRAVALPIKTAKEREAALTAHQEVVQRITATYQAQCAVPASVGWQARFIDSLQAREATCRAELDRVVQFKVTLEQVITYLEDDLAIANVIATIPQPAELADAEWLQQVETWGVIIQKTTNLTVSESFEPTKMELLERISTIRTAWQKVIAASDAKDRTAYVAAQKTLAAAYDDVNELIMEDHTDSLTELLQPLPAAYNKAFPRSI